MTRSLQPRNQAQAHTGMGPLNLSNVHRSSSMGHPGSDTFIFLSIPDYQNGSLLWTQLSSSPWWVQSHPSCPASNPKPAGSAQTWPHQTPFPIPAAISCAGGSQGSWMGALPGDAHLHRAGRAHLILCNIRCEKRDFWIQSNPSAPGTKARLQQSCFLRGERDPVT